MDTTEKYLKLIKHNSYLLDILSGYIPKHLKNENFSDWKMTTIFYITCIYMKTVSILFGEDIQDHYTLRQVINTKKELWTIAKDYRHIEEASRDARYEGRTFEKQYFLDRILPKYNNVRNCAINILNKYNISDIPNIDIQTYLEK